MKAIYKILIVIIVSTISNMAVAQDVYTTIKTNTYLNLRVGPGTEYASKGKLYNGASVKIVNINNYENGWVCVEDNSGRVGFVSASHLAGNYVEQFNTNNNSQEKYDSHHTIPQKNVIFITLFHKISYKRMNC